MQKQKQLLLKHVHAFISLSNQETNIYIFFLTFVIFNNFFFNTFICQKKSMSQKKRKSCGHQPETRRFDIFDLNSQCSRVAYNSCIECISRYAHTIQKVNDNRLKEAQAFICECICYGKQSIHKKFRALQFCHSIGFPFPYEIFELEKNFNKQQTWWLLANETPAYHIIDQIIKKEWWEHLTLICSNHTSQFRHLEIMKNELLFYFPSNVISLILILLERNCQLQ